MKHFITIDQSVHPRIKSNNIPLAQVRMYTPTNLYILCACVHLLDTRNTCTSECMEDANGYKAQLQMEDSVRRGQQANN
jgi:hypothetical protein